MYKNLKWCCTSKQIKPLYDNIKYKDYFEPIKKYSKENEKKEAERRRKEKYGNSFFSLLVVEVVPNPRADLTLEIFLLRFPNPPFYRYDSSF